MNFLGMQPRITQVPPTRCSSATATRAPPTAAKPGGARAAGACADDEQVVVVVGQGAAPLREDGDHALVGPDQGAFGEL